MEASEIICQLKVVRVSHQALLQVRIFVAGDPDVPLHDESAVLAAMRRAVVGD